MGMLDDHPENSSRRRFLEGATGIAASLAAARVIASPGTASAAAVGAPVAAPSVLRADPGRTLSRIAFGSCSDQDKPQPIWDAVNTLDPELFVFLGDNIYADTRDMDLMRAKYAQLAAKPGFQRLLGRTPVMATWDDHDYGENDAGADYPLREESRRIFCDFWGEPADSPRRSREGIYTSAVFGPPGRRVQLLLPDLRFNRSPMVQTERGGLEYRAWAERLAKAGQPVVGPYARNPDPKASMLGEAQWRWLEEQLRVPAELRVFASSVQVLADFTGWESWGNFAHDQQRLLDLLWRSGAKGLVMISGDMHYAELSTLALNTPYPLWDLTSSGLTEVFPYPAPNVNRASEVLAEQNFGVLEIAWDGEPRVTLQARDVTGRVCIEKTVSLAALAPGA
jgi:alkaline phosphatase D